MKEEMKELEDRGTSFVSRPLPFEARPPIPDYQCCALDNAREKARGAKAIGTTGRESACL